MTNKRIDGLPPFAVEFLQSNPQATAIVHKFHQWLKATRRPVLGLTAAEVATFQLHLKQERVDEARRGVHWRMALRYFEWLRMRGLLPFDARRASSRSNFILPLEAERFLQSLKPTHKLATVHCYRANLRQFHIWLNVQTVSLARLKRAHTAAWMQWLYARGLHPATRLMTLQRVRCYLYWLQQQGLLTVDVDLLIQRTDLPKLPQYLPRPIPPEVDKELQRRLKKSRCPYQLGLLLMRRTGLRISELINLTYDCIRYDPKGNAMLKVPLGKMNNERLVPLDANTVKLVHKLQHRIRRRRPHLLQTDAGKRTYYHLYRLALGKACTGLSLAEPMTTHRLRHTYATSLLAGGMSIVGVMRLLGHRDYRMTLRYTAITDETVLIEYTEALKRNEQRYLPVMPTTHVASSSDPAQLLGDVVRQLQRQAKDQVRDQSKTRILVRRLCRLRTQILNLTRQGRG